MYIWDKYLFIKTNLFINACNVIFFVFKFFFFYIFVYVCLNQLVYDYMSLSVLSYIDNVILWQILKIQKFILC